MTERKYVFALAIWLVVAGAGARAQEPVQVGIPEVQAGPETGFWCPS